LIKNIKNSEGREKGPGDAIEMLRDGGELWRGLFLGEALLKQLAEGNGSEEAIVDQSHLPRHLHTEHLAMEEKRMEREAPQQDEYRASSC